MGTCFESGKVNPVALRKAKIACNFGLSECHRVKEEVVEEGYAPYLYLGIVPIIHNMDVC